MASWNRSPTTIDHFEENIDVARDGIVEHARKLEEELKAANKRIEELEGELRIEKESHDDEDAA